MKNVTFWLGPAVGLAQRNLTITRMRGAGDDVAIVPLVNVNLAGGAENTTQALTDNRIWQAVLTDTRNSGEVSVGDELNFNTGTLQFPGPVSDYANRLQILSMEDLSSSASSESSSVSSVSSSVSSSSSSSASSNSSSSSESTSTSSISTSISSLSSLSSSSASSASSASSSSWSSTSVSSSNSSSASTSMSSSSWSSQS